MNKRDRRAKKTAQIWGRKYRKSFAKHLRKHCGVTDATRALDRAFKDPNHPRYRQAGFKVQYTRYDALNGWDCSFYYNSRILSTREEAEAERERINNLFPSATCRIVEAA